MAAKMEDSISINQKFAAKYEQRKRREELAHLEKTYDNADEDSESSEEEDEDEHGDLVVRTHAHLSGPLTQPLQLALADARNRLADC